MMTSQMTSQSYFEQFLIYSCSPEECPRSVLNANNFSIKAHIIIIFAWHTYLGNIARLKKTKKKQCFMVVCQMSRSQGLQATRHNMAVTPSIFGVSKWYRNRNVEHIMINVWNLSPSTALAFVPHSIILVTTPYCERYNFFPFSHSTHSFGSKLSRWYRQLLKRT